MRIQELLQELQNQTQKNELDSDQVVLLINISLLLLIHSFSLFL